MYKIDDPSVVKELSVENDNTSFDLYREAMRQYELIVPNQVDGLVLLSLFDQFGQDGFKEDQINTIIDKVYRDLGGSSQRSEYDRNNSVVIRLQEFYLSRDEHNKSYQFKTFGRQFCENLKERLISTYNPARIKRLFDGLLLDLERYLKSPENNFDMWFSDHFLRIRPEITAHVEILDQQVSQSVREFRKRFKQGDTDISTLLDEIISKLEGIKQQAGELKAAFSATYNIDQILDEALLSNATGADPKGIQQVFDFNKSIRGQLEQISLRIEHIKPRIREFIYEFNQRDFDRKTGLFLDFLIKNASSSKTEEGKAFLKLPERIPEFMVYDPGSFPKFVIVPDKDISKKPPVEVTKRIVDLERQQQMIDQAKMRLHEKQRISFWITEIRKRLLQVQSLDYSGMFLEILEHEKGKLSIPLRLTAKILRDFRKKGEYNIEIKQEHYSGNKKQQIRLWKMNIKKN
ncbi:hypothetical protein [uncultured Pedobacter sp.]|uniref:hypothetical protein n=1 Tax=uncultured Pedobacter sp. TaxID=246139 RepID=UPI0025D341CB|nr:hypothetical protein [uncultured Pedobacter sp.]